MSTALFIDDDYLKEWSPLGKSIDVDEIYPFVSNAQDVYIQDLLGTPLYEDITTKITNGSTFSTIEWKLIDLCSKALVYHSTDLALPHIMIKMRNGGVLKTNAEYNQTSTLSEMKYLREEMKNLAEFWNQRVINFLCENSSEFPLYNAASEDMYPTTKAYDSDLYIDEYYKDLTLEELKFLKKYLS